MVFSRLDGKNVAAAVVRQIEANILDGTLRPGDRLAPERDLATQFDVSRPTVRAAIAELEQRGLLVSKHGGGTTVAPLLDEGFVEPMVRLFRSSSTAAMDYLEFRFILEGEAAFLAATRATDSNRKLIDFAFQKMVVAHEKKDPREEADLDADFHIAVIEAAHNPVIAHVMHGFLGLLREGVYYNRNGLYATQPIRESFLDQHRAIRDAVLAGDAEASRDAVHAHLTFVRTSLQARSAQEQREKTANRRLKLAISKPSGRRAKTSNPN